MTLEAGNTYRFDLEGWWTNRGTLYDPYLHGIHDATGALIAGTSNDDGGAARSSRVTFTPDVDGTYYVSAGADGDHLGRYTLSVAEVRASSRDDYSADTGTTGTVAVGASVIGEIESGGDQDWFAVTLEADQTYRFDLKGWPAATAWWNSRRVRAAPTTWRPAPMEIPRHLHVVGGRGD